MAFLAFRRQKLPRRAALVLLLGLFSVIFPINGHAQSKKAKSKPVPPVNELAKLQEDFIKATKEYKANLAKLQTIYERNVTRAEGKLAQNQVLFKGGLVSKNQLAESETAVAAAKEKVSEAVHQMATADSQIANTLLEAQAEASMTKTPMRKGSLLTTTSYISYSGAGAWMLSDAWKVRRFFLESFKKQLPVAVFGQGSIHDRWRLDHRNAMDISLHPDGPEGHALMNYLRANRIPFLAFRAAIPGTATGPHIHIGWPSHRF